MRTTTLAVIVALALTACARAPAPAQAPVFNVVEASVADLQKAMTTQDVSSEAIVEAYLARIAALDDAGPTLNAVIVVNPNAREDARALDRERKEGAVRGPLHGVPVLIKDNIETADPMPTTAGSLALAQNVTGRDAPLVARLRAAGAVILGKTNLSEWANIRSSRSVSGWSAVGGLTRNPYALDRNACGSSSGSGAAVAASLSAVAIGTETDGSVTCPSSVAGLVGIKPTVGLVSRGFVVPISHSQDTAGPMGRSVADVAAVLSVIAGTDPADPATAGADAHRADYSAALDLEALKGKRLGVLRFYAGFDRAVDARFAAALDIVRAAGAEIVEISARPAALDAIERDELTVLLAELKSDMNAYLATTPAAVRTRTLADLIAFNARTPAETALFGQELFEQAQATHGVDDPAYRAAQPRARRAAAQTLDRLMSAHRVDALIAPTMGPAWTTDIVLGDHFVGGGVTTLPAVAGYPHVTTPMGLADALPVGLSFIGEAWSEAKLLAFAYAFEQRARARAAPSYPATIANAEPFASAIRGAGGS